jgi:hypothetical protein
VDADIRIAPVAMATRAVTGLPLTSTILALPLSSECVSFVI